MPAPLSPLVGVPAGLARLASAVHENASNLDAFVTAVLKLLAESLSVAQAHVTRIDGTVLRYERVYDQGGMNVHEGDAIPLTESYCQVMLETARPSLIVEDALADERFAALACTSIVGIGAYTGVPLYQTGGRLYGTLCTLHPEARVVNPDEPGLLSLAGRIIIQAIEADDVRRHLLEISQATGQALQNSTERYRAVVECSPDAIMVTDLAGIVQLSNQQAADMFGFSDPEALVGVHIVDRIAAADRERASRALHERRTGALPRARNTQYALLRRDGSIFPAEVNSSVILRDDGQPTGLTVVFHDISERKHFERQLLHQASHDALTDLPNRTLFQDRLQQLIDSSRREDSSSALLLLDLDGFKELNDTFGHGLGDRLLQQLAHRLQATCRDSDTVARLGGDEFAILLPRTRVEDALRASEKVSGVVRTPINVDGHRLALDGNIGIAVYPRDGRDAATLLRRADVAMYAAKHARTPHMLYDRAFDRESGRRLALSQTLMQALESAQFLLHYQPKLDLRTGSMAGVEALIRWEHPEFGLVSPGEFIPLAEHSGLITLITRWVLDEALNQARRWHDSGLDIQVAVNLSARSLHDQQLVDMICDSLNRAGASPAWLVVEITESQIMVDPDHALRILESLRATGVTIAIDDFGTGFSSLAYLDTLPAQELKIDRAFVLDMEDNDSHRRIVQATINLAHELRLRAVAEGVETQQALDVLQGFGCDSAQGYHISRPLPSTDIAAWARTRACAATGSDGCLVSPPHRQTVTKS